MVCHISRQAALVPLVFVAVTVYLYLISYYAPGLTFKLRFPGT